MTVGIIGMYLLHNVTSLPKMRPLAIWMDFRYVLILIGFLDVGYLRSIDQHLG